MKCSANIKYLQTPIWGFQKQQQQGVCIKIQSRKSTEKDLVLSQARWHDIKKENTNKHVSERNVIVEAERSLWAIEAVLTDITSYTNWQRASKSNSAHCDPHNSS